MDKLIVAMSTIVIIAVIIFSAVNTLILLDQLKSLRVDPEDALCKEHFNQVSKSISIEKSKVIPHKGVRANTLTIVCEDKK